MAFHDRQPRVSNAIQAIFRAPKGSHRVMCARLAATRQRLGKIPSVSHVKEARRPSSMARPLANSVGMALLRRLRG